MEEIKFKLKKEEFDKLNRDPNIGEGSINASKTGKRAVELVKLYFLRKDPNCNFLIPGNGSDLEITCGNITQRIEVKGTVDTKSAWAKLIVSGEPSHKLLEDGLPLYRVCGVYNDEPVIFIMQHGSDFEMVPEVRWRVKQIKKEKS
ncbi:MAG: hypothetical protein HZB81_04615 [Deltaproteobacteria bacterium]|nr:hypothetical protein [Deltaproteobacteria bacterium]